MGKIIGALIIFLVIMAIIFLICREIFCWYWKFNKMVDLQEKQNELLKKLTSQLKQSVSNRNIAQPAKKTNLSDDSHQKDDDNDISRDDLFK